MLVIHLNWANTWFCWSVIFWLLLQQVRQQLLEQLLHIVRLVCTHLKILRNIVLVAKYNVDYDGHKTKSCSYFMKVNVILWQFLQSIINYFFIRDCWLKFNT